MAIGGLLVAFWWVPFGTEQAYSTSLGYVNINTFVTILFPQADWWALILAGLSTVAAFALRSRFGILMALLAGLFALGVIFDPQASLYNVRLLPLWFLPVYLLAGWGVATAVTGAVDLWTWLRDTAWTWLRHTAWPWLVDAFTRVRNRLRRSAPGESAVEPSARPGREIAPPRGRSSFPTAAVAGSLAALVVALVVVVTPFVMPLSTMRSLGITPGANQVTNWSSFNYSGYQAQDGYPEYRALVLTMERVGSRYGCGQSMWQYDPSLNRFGTTQALMLLPYWSSGCIGSMEGLLFESSATTPYHFLNQAELSVSPSEAMVSCATEANDGCLNYSALNIPAGIQHLQLLGVRYFMASSPQVEAAASADTSLRQVAETGPWTSDGTTTTWKIYEVLDAPLVTGLANEPAVEVGVRPNQSSWLPPSESWYNDPSRWSVFLAQSGPASWPRVAIGDPAPPRRAVPATHVSEVEESDNTVSFHVSKTGTPVLVKVSYFPNWHASGATGPYRVTPNLMVVVPTSHNVVLSYGATPANRAGQALSILGVVLLLVVLIRPRVGKGRRRRGSTPSEPDLSPAT
jgi:hypothetical protein